jgi:hypothetical protein
MNYRHVNSIQWEQAIGCARAACARIFCDGRGPGAALAAFGLSSPDGTDWSTAIDRIALALCTRQQQRKAA